VVLTRVVELAIEVIWSERIQKVKWSARTNPEKTVAPNIRPFHCRHVTGHFQEK
jgi:hypothetical protein